MPTTPIREDSPKKAWRGGLPISRYNDIHQWVRKNFVRPDACEHCGDKNPSRFHWANLDGKYSMRRKDWVNLCPSCHKVLDERKSHCVRGHEYNERNIYQFPKGNQQRCRECNRQDQREHFARQQQKKEIEKAVAKAKLECAKHTERAVLEARKPGYDINRLGTWVFIETKEYFETLDDLYWSYVQEFVANNNPYREEPYEKMDYIKKNMPYASFSGVGTTKLFAKADQRAKERITTLKTQLEAKDE